MHRLTLRLLSLATAVAALPASTFAVRATGIDVSYYQGGSINWSSVAASGIQFAFIRATRGGTTGDYDSSTPIQASARYDDPYTARNVAGANANGILTGVYHFARIDLINSTDPLVPTYHGNTGLDEANHFLQTAQQYMRPGALLPTLDVEAGDTQTTAAQLTAWCMEFSDRILAATGVRPLVYINANYATNEVTSAINVHNLWLARYLYTSSQSPTQATRDSYAAQAQTIAPPTPSGYSSPYGVFKTAANPVPWNFWQYSDGGRTPGISGDVDQDIANGDINYVRQFLIPAIWMADADGSWSTAANWNGQVVLPTVNDRTILNRTSGDYLITLTSGAQAVRSLQQNERLTINGGSLNATEYVNVANTLTVNGGTLSADAIANTATLAQNGGLVVTNTLTGTGTTTVTGGTLRAKTIKANILNVSGGTALLLDASASVLKSLAVTGTGQLDLGDAGLIVDYTGTSPLASVRASLLNGFAGGAWNGRGIVSSALGDGEGIAYLDASTLFTNFPAATFRGEAIDNTSILLVRAFGGDTNLDGNVDFDDLLQIARSYNNSATWRNGDFNYDGIADFDDLLVLAGNYAHSGVQPLGFGAGAFSSTFEGDWSLAQSLLPEPTSCVATAMALALGGRRRRHRA